MDLIPLFKVHMPRSVEGPLLQTLFSGFIGQGPKVNEFEEKLCAYFGVPHALTLNSGTSGLHLALRLADVGPGDEVISTPMTCTATNMPVLAAGAKLVWADIDPESGNISPTEIEKKITARTKAIIVVHWGGYPCDLDEINAIAARHGLKVIEDAAHGFGAEYKGRKIAGHSDFVMFSLQAIKHISTVDGGVLFCRNSDDYERGKLLRWYGIDRESNRKDFRCEEDIAEWGYKFHMHDVAATIGLEQMKYVDGILQKMRNNSKFYDEALQGVDGVRTIRWKADRKSACWLYTLHVERRQAFMEFMKQKNVMVSQVHARNDNHTTFRPYASGRLSNVDRFASTMVCIPNGWWVEPEQLRYVADAVHEFSRAA